MRRGQVVGVRLFGITPGSPLRAWGLENGDILVAAGGEALTRPEALLRLASLTGPLPLTVERRGQRLALEVPAR
jgi:type II secretory pathway component PulC